MEHYCSDVNTIFAFVDIRHKFHVIVNEHFNNIKKDKYVLLKHVKQRFIFTYNDNLKKIGEIILATVSKVKELLNKRRMKREPSEVVKNLYLKKEMQKLIMQQKDKEMNPTDYDYYKNILLNEFPLIELLNDEEKLEEFDSAYIEKAEEIVNEKFSEFVCFFDFIDKNPRLNSMNVRKWYKELVEFKKNNKNMFTDYDDEDIWLSSEYLTYCEDRRISLNFSSTDKNLTKSLKYVIKNKHVKTGKVILLLD